jgi:hypothetical protein
MIAVEVQHFLGRARDFLKGMDLLKDDLTEFRFSSALLAIHCAISYSDAMRTGMGCANVSLDDHQSAARDLKSRLVSRNHVNRKGLGHLEKLLSGKNRVQYDSVTVRENEVEDIVKHAERFARWAEESGRQLRIEGW